MSSQIKEQSWREHKWLRQTMWEWQPLLSISGLSRTLIVQLVPFLANSGVLTNFDVLNFLKAKGASKDLARVLANVAPSEYKIFDYLVATPACTQTRESIDEFKEKCREYDLAEAEVLNIINTRPYNVVGIFPMIEDIDSRLGEKIQDLVDMVVEVLPSLPVPAATDESGANTADAEKIEHENDNNEEEPENEEPMET
ncbi:hypothetical protein ACFX11_012655 [Malus domestica]